MGEEPPGENPVLSGGRGNASMPAGEQPSGLQKSENVNMITPVEMHGNGSSGAPSGPGIFPVEPPVNSGTVRESKGIPWEQARSRGVVKSLGETWTLAVFSPRRFFRFLREPAEGWAAPLMYAILLGTAGTLLGLPGMYLFGNLWWADLGLGMGEFSWDGIMIILITVPFLSMFKVLMLGGVFHLLVRGAGGKRGFGNTLRVIAYAESLEVFQVIPSLGGPAASLYKLILYFFGLREAQGLTAAKAIVVIVTPILLIGLAGAVMMGILGSLGIVFE